MGDGASFCDTLVDEEGHKLENFLSLVPCFTGTNSVLFGVGAEPRILGILQNLWTVDDVDLRPDLADRLVEISQAAPEMGLSSDYPKPGETTLLCPLDSSSCDSESRWRIAGLFVGVLHLDSRFNTNIELGIYRRYELVCFLRGDLCDATIRQNGFGNSEAKCHDSYLLSQGTPPVKKGLISGYLHYIILCYACKYQQKSPILGHFMRILKFSFIYMVRADIFIRFFGSFLIQNCGSDFSDFWPPPPKAAK